jgi:8-oxo-dGTP diphosphatase
MTDEKKTRRRDPNEPTFCGRCGQPLESQERGGEIRPHCPACGWVFYAKNALGAAVLIESADGKLLLIQRAHDPFKDWWMLPAGFVEYGESALDTAVREAEEETGLTVELDDLQGLYFGADDPRDVAHLAAYHARVLAGTPQAGDDAAAVGFFGPDELPRQIAFEGQRQAIEAWRRLRAGETGPGEASLSKA